MASPDLDVLFRRYRHRVLRFVRSRLGAHGAAAPDLTQEAFLRLSARSAHGHIHNESSLLFTVAANLATDHLRVEGRRLQILERAADEHFLTTEEITPERIASGRSELSWVVEALGRMPARQRRVLLLYHLNGQTQREIACQLGLGLSTVRADLKSAIGALVDARRRAMPS